MLERYQGKTVLVTGATGFIGSALCKALARHGVKVHGAARQIPEKNDDSIRYHSLDLTVPSDTSALLEETKPNIIFHLAGFVFGGREVNLVEPAFTGNLSTTVNILQSASTGLCQRVILSGSMEELGQLDHRGEAHSPYAIAKQCATLYGRFFKQNYGLSVINARFFMVYGPGQYGPHKNKLIPSVISALLKGESPQVNNGKRAIDWIYVDDVVEALVQLGVCDEGEYDGIDIGTGKLVTIQSIVEKLVNFIDAKAKVVYGESRSRGYEVEAAADISLAKKILNWAPKVDLDTGLQNTVSWYKDVMNNENERGSI